MKAAVASNGSKLPIYTDFEEPSGNDGAVVVEVRAAAVHHVDMARVAGYLGPVTYPMVCGVDGVGIAPDGRRVYFTQPALPFGSWAERTLVNPATFLSPADGVDDVTAAALGNAGLAAWLSLAWRAALQPGESVLVLGANGAVGSIAVQAAKLLGAGTVVAASRDPARLERHLDRGADATVVLDDDTDLAQAVFAAVGGPVDVIIDPLWGAPALAAMAAGGPNTRLIQLGQLGGVELSLPAPLVRVRGLDIRGFAIPHVPPVSIGQAYGELTAHAARGDLVVDLETLPLSAAAEAWSRQIAGPETKLVLVPETPQAG